MSNDSNPLVTIITITLNSALYLQQTIEGVLAQNFQDFEYLIVDGGSADSTIEIVKSFNDSRIKIFKGIDDGISDAMNRGISYARGKYIGIIHSDDVYLENAISASVKALESTGSHWSYGKMEYMDETGRPLFIAGNPFNLKALKRRMTITHPTVFCTKALYQELGNFNKKYRLAMDYDLCLRFALRYSPVFIPLTIARMRLGGASSQSEKAELSGACEVFHIKNEYFHQQKFQNSVYFAWQKFKIYSRHRLKQLPAGASLVEKLRPYVNPNHTRLS